MASRTMNPTGSGPTGPPIPSLHLVYLPYRTQHRVLNKIQALLEESCFEFGKKWLSQIIAREGWEGPESGELTKWTMHLKKHIKHIPIPASCQIAGIDWERVFSGCRQLRHTAVHRLRITAKGILSLLDDANDLTKMLNDIERSSRIETVKDRLQSSIDDMVRNKHLLEEKLIDELQVIAKRRAELDYLGRAAVDNMRTSDEEYITLVGSALESVVMRLDTEPYDATCPLGGNVPDADKISPQPEDNEAYCEYQMVAEDGLTIAQDNWSAAEECLASGEASLAQGGKSFGEPASAKIPTLAGDVAAAE